MAVATEFDFEVLPHSPYYTDLATADFYVFSKQKTNLRGRNFRSNDGVIDAVNEYLGDQDEDFYFEGIRKPEQGCRKCITMNGDYVETKWQMFIPGYSEVHEAENFLIIPRIH